MREMGRLIYRGSEIATANHSLLLGMVDQPEDVFVDTVARNPQLLNAYVQVAEIESLAADQRNGDNPFHVLFARLAKARHDLEESPQIYPLGLGPIEPVWSAVKSRQISRAHGQTLVARPEVAWALSGAYLRALSRHAVVLAQQFATGPEAWELQELLLAAVASLPIGEDEGEVGRVLAVDMTFMVEETTSDWLLAALGVLRAAPDGRLYRRAQVVGEALVKRLRATGSLELLGRVLFRLGGLGLDPYAGMPFDEAAVRQELRRRLLATLDPAETETVDWHEADMPGLWDAFTRAETHYAEAVTLRTGSGRGLALKGQLQVLRGLRVLGQQVPDERLQQLAEDAISELDPVDDEHVVLSIRSMMADTGLSIRFDRCEGTPGRTAAAGTSYAAQKSIAFDRELERASLTARDDPETALRSLFGLSDDARAMGSSARERLWREQRHHLLSMRGRSESPARWPSVGLAPAPFSLSVLADQTQQALDLEQAARESEAFAVLAAAVTDLDPQWGGLDESLGDLALRLAVGAAVNELNRAPGLTVEWYGTALQEAMRLGVEEKVVELVERLGLLAHKEVDASIGTKVCQVLLPVAERLVADFPLCRFHFHRTCTRALARSAHEGMTETTAEGLRQMLKGLSFSAALQADAGYSVDTDAAGQRWLNLIDSLTEGPGVVDESGDLFSEESLLTTYTGSREVRAGTTPGQRLANAQRAFDERVFEHVITQGRGANPWPSADDIRGSLDDHTVLVDLLLGADVDGDLATYTWLYTSASVDVLRAPSPDLDGLPSWTGDDRSLLVHPMAGEVRELRDTVLEYPGLGRQVSPEAESALDRMASRLFAGSWGMGVLEHLRSQGRNHLLVVPHGPLHYAPIHLLPFGDGILADFFTVTFLPNRGLLGATSQATRSRDRTSDSALGLSFQHRQPFDLPPLPASVEELTEIAAVFGQTALVDDMVTEAVVRKALEASRYMHLSTHGRYVGAGAAFQMIYLWPDASSDGRLHAYELLDMDLRGVEVITLSACETALGRFDLLDNLRGLPMSLFLRGVETVVGTLWQAEADASRTFFTTFYKTLLANAGNRLTAFRQAQAETRLIYPAYRDWGAFYLMGAT